MEGVPNNVFVTHVLSRLGPVGRAGLAASCRRFRDLERELPKDPFTQRLTEALRLFSSFMYMAWLDPLNGLHGDVVIEVDGYMVGYDTMDRLPCTDRATGDDIHEVLSHVDDLLLKEATRSDVIPEGRQRRRGSPLRITDRPPESPFRVRPTYLKNKSLSVHMTTTRCMRVDKVLDFVSTLSTSLPSWVVEIEASAGDDVYYGRQMNVRRTRGRVLYEYELCGRSSREEKGSGADLEHFLRQHIPSRWLCNLYVSVVFV